MNTVGTVEPMLTSPSKLSSCSFPRRTLKETFPLTKIGKTKIIIEQPTQNSALLLRTVCKDRSLLLLLEVTLVFISSLGPRAECWFVFLVQTAANVTRERVPESCFNTNAHMLVEFALKIVNALINSKRVRRSPHLQADFVFFLSSALSPTHANGEFDVVVSFSPYRSGHLIPLCWACWTLSFLYSQTPSSRSTPRFVHDIPIFTHSFGPQHLPSFIYRCAAQHIPDNCSLFDIHS